MIKQISDFDTLDNYLSPFPLWIAGVAVAAIVGVAAKKWVLRIVTCISNLLTNLVSPLALAYSSLYVIKGVEPKPFSLSKILSSF